MMTESQLTKPGYYWWLPQMFAGDPAAKTLPENWSIISWHPANDLRQKSGYFVGPLPVPIFSDDI